MNKKNLLEAAVFFVFVAVFIFVKNYQAPVTTPNTSFSHSSSTISQTLVVSTTGEKVSVDFSVGQKKYSLNLPLGSTVYGAMNILASTTDFSFKANFYPGLGYFVEEINGTKNQDSVYWTLYINGVYSNVGASDYVLKQGDSVEWKYEK